MSGDVGRELGAECELPIAVERRMRLRADSRALVGVSIGIIALKCAVQIADERAEPLASIGGHSDAALVVIAASHSRATFLSTTD